MSLPVLELRAARSALEYLPRTPFNLVLDAGDFALIEVPGSRRGAAFADLCVGLGALLSGQVRFLGRDWATTPVHQADALRGRTGRLFHTPLRSDTPNVAERLILRRLHHTRLARDAVIAEATELAVRFGLPGLPVGSARLLTAPDLLRAGCVRAFLGFPPLVIVELPPAAQAEGVVQALLTVGAEARGRGSCVIWLAASGTRLRDRSIQPTHRLRLGEAGLSVASRVQPVPA